MEDKERRATVDAIKVKEEKLEVAGGKCWKRKWLRVLCFAGEIYSMKVIFAAVNAKEPAESNVFLLKCAK